MTRKESEKDSERPHYYSQFWLDVAAGRKIIGAPKANDETDTFDSELEPIVLYKPDRHGSAAISDDYEETIAHPEVEPEVDADEYAEPELEEVELENEVEEEEIPNIVLEEAEIPDIILAPLEVEEEIVEEVPSEEIEEEEEFFDEEEEEEEEDDQEWNVGRGRKKPKPRGVAAKLPPKLPPKKAKREPRRGF
jgi:hypothetical protein